MLPNAFMPSSLIMTNEVPSSISVNLSLGRFTLSKDRLTNRIHSNINSVLGLLGNLFEQYNIKTNISLSEFRNYLLSEIEPELNELHSKIDDIFKVKNINKRIKKAISLVEEIKERDLEAVNSGVKFVEFLLTETHIKPSLIGNMSLFLDIELHLTEKLWDLETKELESILRTPPSKYPGRVKLVIDKKKRLLDELLGLNSVKEEVLPFEREARILFTAIICYIMLNYAETLKDLDKINVKKLIRSTETLNSEALLELDRSFLEKLNIFMFKALAIKEPKIVSIKPLPKETANFWILMAETY
ncbi:MAG: hypothetical protein DRN04_13945 [Thermoprotei archaeon]|nr:MAG: hypothetical protein DRN04_13945 [Thermoprotei archaeon]